MSFLKLLQGPRNRNLLEIVSQLPRLGVGSRVTRQKWVPYGDSYWEITAVKPKGEDGLHGKVWGIKYWKGARQNEEPVQINGRTKRVWRWMVPEEEAAHYRRLMRELKAAESASSSQTADSQAAGGEQQQQQQLPQQQQARE